MAEILIIDDDTQLLQLLDVAFKKYGHTVTTAMNGKKALDMIKVQAFDVVITDIIMPEVNGIEVLTALAKMSDRPAVIAMSGGSQRINYALMLATAKVMKADMVLPKPIMPRQLLDAVETLLANNRKPRQET